MPILVQEPDLFPSDLLDLPETGCETDRQWWVVHTRSRQEKLLARELSGQGVAHYVPQYENRTQSPSGRRRVSYVPLFPGYAFVYGNDEDRFRTLDCRATSKLLPVGDGERLTYELRQIRQLILSGQSLTPEEYLQPGTKVRIKSGPLRMIEGQIVQRRSGDRLLVAVDYLQKGVSVELGSAEIELL